MESSTLPPSPFSSLDENQGASIIPSSLLPSVTLSLPPSLCVFFPSALLASSPPPYFLCPSSILPSFPSSLPLPYAPYFSAPGPLPPARPPSRAPAVSIPLCVKPSFSPPSPGQLGHSDSTAGWPHSDAGPSVSVIYPY